VKSDLELLKQGSEQVSEVDSHVNNLMSFSGSKYTKKLGLQLKKTGFSSDFTENVNPTVSNSFATAGVRFRVSMMVGNIG
jgi:hypothetical protein